MTFLDWPQEIDRPPRAADARRKRTAEDLIARFATAFPQIDYTLVWGSKLLNAQAWRLGEQRNVYVYGGLVRHPLITRPGLALTIAHETGHHLGGEPRDPLLSWMSWQGQADYWAASVGMRAVFGAEAEGLIIKGARQIGALQRVIAEMLGEEPAEFRPRARAALFRAGLRHAGLPRFALQALETERAWRD